MPYKINCKVKKLIRCKPEDVTYKCQGHNYLKTSCNNCYALFKNSCLKGLRSDIKLTYSEKWLLQAVLIFVFVYLVSWWIRTCVRFRCSRQIKRQQCQRNLTFENLNFLWCVTMGLDPCRDECSPCLIQVAVVVVVVFWICCWIRRCIRFRC